MLPIADPGLRLVGGGLLLSGALWLLLRSPSLSAAALAFAAFSAYFFRDPERRAEPDPAVAYAPGEGTVLSVEREGPGDATTLRIFLSVMNVHVQRVPLDGKVARIVYQTGPKKVASLPAARRNERNVVSLETADGPVVVEQITGAVARRIQCYLREGDQARQGQRLGIIHFGSQVALHLPAPWEFTVRPGDKVVAGVTVVARRRSSGG